MAKKQWPKLGTIRVSEDANGNKKTRLVLDKDVTIHYKGEQVVLDQYRMAFLKDKNALLDSLSFMQENGYIDEESYNKQVSAIEEKGVKYEILIPQD